MIKLARPRRLWPLAAAIAAVMVGFSQSDEPALAQGGLNPAAQTFEIVARHSDKCLSVDGASSSDGAAVVQWACVRQDNQRWSAKPAGDGSYYLVARHSGECLSVDGGSPEDGAAAVQWSCVGQENQKWTIEPAAGGTVNLIAQHSGRCLSVYGGALDDSANAVQWACFGGSNQQWIVRAASGGGGDGTTADIVRFLEQSTWGPTPALIDHVKEVGIEAFLEEQFNAPVSSYPTLPLFPGTRDNETCPAGSTCQRDNYTMYLLQRQFFADALYAEDQLRQRVAFALHQIIVVSANEVTLPSYIAPYLQILDNNAFGNFRQLLFDITVNPAMGSYLDVTGNTRTRPNENYAREILQLFSIGTVRLNQDGTPQLDANGEPIPTYGQEEVNNFSRVFTGWVRAPLVPAQTGVANYIDPMVTNENNHDVGTKTLLGGAVLSAGQNTRTDTNAALDNIFNHPNVGPFISKQLIQHLVTSNPSPEYVERVARVFNGEGTGSRGDLRAVVRAILLDPEARGDVKADSSYGHLRHPALFITGILRAFNAKSADGGTSSDGYLNPNSTALGMNVFTPPSVFSYFLPTTGVPGGRGLRGPEFGLLSTSTALARANFVNTIVFSRINVSANAPNGTSLDFGPWLSLANDAGALVDALDALLLHGSMSAAMRTSIVNAVNAVDPANALKRVRTAVYLVASSSQYQVGR